MTTPPAGAAALEAAVEFAENPEPRCPCVLLIDTSGSMRGEPIDALNDGLRRFQEELASDALAARRVEVAVVGFASGVQVVQDFVTADRFAAPTLDASGLTAMGGGIHRALDLVAERKALYKASGVAYYRPWVFMITDGEPQGEPDEVVESAAQRVHDEETARRVAFFAVGVQGANLKRLSTLVPRTPLRLNGLDFGEMFVWLSSSMQKVSQSRIDDQVSLAPPGWAAV
ncbi:MAG: hypothetical protein AMXMBFR64_46050 [Myxococcales bacterium]